MEGSIALLSESLEPADVVDEVSHDEYKATKPPRKLYALAINFYYDADRFWEALYSLGIDKLPGELVPVVKDYWECTLPMTSGRLAVVRGWLAGLPSWQGTDDDTRPATAFVEGEVHECEACRGEGARGFKCDCSRHNEDCDRVACRTCSGRGYFVV